MELHLVIRGLHLVTSGLHFVIRGLHLVTSGLHFVIRGLHLVTSGLHFVIRGLHLVTSGLHLGQTRVRADWWGTLHRLPDLPRDLPTLCHSDERHLHQLFTA